MRNSLFSALANRIALKLLTGVLHHYKYTIYKMLQNLCFAFNTNHIKRSKDKMVNFYYEIDIPRKVTFVVIIIYTLGNS